MSSVVVVESPSKAKTINKYLGSDYTVLASFGHVRDLPSKDGSVRPDDDFSMIYVVDDDSKKHISAIAKAAKTADTLILATDPDREGEAISWHVLEALKESKAVGKKLNVQRVTFHEITKKSIIEAFKHPREIDMNMVNAQQARRALDYLVGFTLSPVLWRKLPGSKSAGRVQSVALRLICDRDEEIEQFISREYWDIKAILSPEKGANLSARLIEYKGEKLEKFSITDGKKAESVAADLRTKNYSVANLEEKQVRRHPSPPFTTSTLQQEASRKCGFGAKRTMQIAQKLYEDGHITYMRTDGINVSPEAVSSAREHIGKSYGKEYVPSAPRMYKNKSKNAQEAHEAIRPTDITLTAQKAGLDGEQAKLYELIWKRMVASQMESALFDQLIVDIAASDKQAVLRTSGSVVRFDGFLKLYQEGSDDEEDEENAKLPVLKKDEKLGLEEVKPEQHFTEPPPRYSEASLVKKLEELGIGRPSTYAAIISVLQDRGYVTLDKKRFVAQSLGRLVNAFLVSFFERYVEYGFTADLENKLDEISAGERDWKQVLRDFWQDFITKIDESKELSVSQVLEALDTLLASYAFGQASEGKDKRACPACSKGRLGLKIGRFGPYIACSNYPDCNHKAQLGELTAPVQFDDNGEEFKLPKTLGKDPVSGEDITLRKGPYGVYVQIGEGKSPKRASLLKSMRPETMTLELALSLLALPRELGKHPDTGKPIVVNNGKFGPYILHDGKFTTLPASEDLLAIGINRAVEVMAQAPQKGAANVALKSLGKHPDDDGEVAIFKGRYGDYIKHGKINATLPKDADIKTFTLEQALPLLAARAAAPAKKGFARKTAKSSPKAEPKEKAATKAKKPVAKKAPAKKKAS
ncbi:MAG: type I DNA topoisomerase [Pseudomonadota bacterium]